MKKTKLEERIEEIYFLKFGKKKSIKQILIEYYIDKHLSIDEVAEELKVGKGTVINYLRKYEIKTRKITFI